MIGIMIFIRENLHVDDRMQCNLSDLLREADRHPALTKGTCRQRHMADQGFGLNG